MSSVLERLWSPTMTRRRDIENGLLVNRTAAAVCNSKGLSGIINYSYYQFFCDDIFSSFKEQSLFLPDVILSP